MNGVVVIHKPTGRTSHDVVYDVKKATGAKKVGHTGTLDPLATGVLPVCINEATKLVQFFSQDTKDYRARMLLGVSTDTLDVEGRVITRRDPETTGSAIEAALNGLKGVIEQTPPAYSAVKFQGKALYKWARKGITVDPGPRTVEIYRVILEEIAMPYVTFTVSCSKGTYIRSLCAEIGDMLGCGACLAGLERTRSGFFDRVMAISLDGLEKDDKRKAILSSMMPLIATLPDMAEVTIDAMTAEKIREGFQPSADTLKTHQIPFHAAGDVIKFTLQGKHLVALGRLLHSSDELPLLDGRMQAVKILRVFNCR